MSADIARKTEQQSLLPLQMLIRGRIDSSRFVDQKYFTIVTTPARDEFSRPQMFEIRSTSRLGEQGQVVEGQVVVSGFVGRKPYTDKKSGESKIFFDSNVFFDWIQ